MSSVFADLGALLGQYGYLAVAVLVLVEDFGVPAPGESVLILASIAARDGRLDILAVAGIAFVAAVVGDNIGFAIGRFGGRPLLHRYGRYVLLTPHRLQRANGLLAGATGMRWRRFLPYNAIGAAAWVGVWSTLGYVAGAHLPEIEHLVTRYELYLLGAALLAAAGFVCWRLLRARRRRRAPSASRPEPR